jgi:hypothetical protein
MGTAPVPVDHSPFGGSGAHRWTVCPGSVRAQHGAPDIPSPYAREGTACHAVAALCLTEKQDAIEYTGRTVEGIEIDDDHAYSIQVYLDTIRHDQKFHGGKLLIEAKFHLKSLHPEFYGTADCVRLGKDGVLCVYDAKFGRGKIVEVVQPNGKPNLQLAFYALGALNILPATLYDEITEIELVVIQPRAWHKDGPVRRQRFRVADIEAVGPVLVAAATLAKKLDAPLVPGDHCEFCRAAGTCPALRAYTLDLAQSEFEFDDEPETPLPVPVDLTPAQLAHILERADIFETWLTAVRARAHLVAETTGLPGWKLVAKQARRKWADETKAAEELLHGFGVERSSIYETKLKSPAQVEKFLTPADRKTDTFKALCPAISSGLTLVRADNPRIAVVPSQVDFDDGTAEEGEW